MPSVLDVLPFRQILEMSQEAVMLCNADLNILYVNPAFERTTGYAAADIVGAKPSRLSSGQHDQYFYQSMWQSIQSLGHWYGLIWNRRRNGDIYPEWLKIHRLEAGGLTYYVGQFSDISAYDTLQHDLQRFAYYDTLTELPNRTLFMELLQSRLRQAQRRSDGFAVLFLDIDHFKQINDIYGHLLGDRLILEVARRLKAALRETDTVARFAGDEFTLLLDDCSDPANLQALCQRILDGFTNPVCLDDSRRQKISVSIGAALYPQHGNNHGELLQHADMALYETKQQGRAGYRLYRSELSQDLQRAAQVLLTLKTELAKPDAGFFVLAQPLFDLASGRMAGIEALLRWQHAELGEVSPEEFIPIAEQHGLSSQVTGRMLQALRADLLSLPPTWTGGLVLSINLSPSELRQPDLIGQLRPLLADCQTLGMSLELDLKETLLQRQLDQDLQPLLALSQAGIGLAIDDFGSGFCSLAALSRLPLRRLKLGRQLLHNLSSFAQDCAIIRSILALATSLQLGVVAKGIETPDQQKALRALGCQTLQGWLFCPPLPLPRLLVDWPERQVRPALAPQD